MPRTKKPKNEKKQNAMSQNTAIQAWREAAKALGYLSPGKFAAIPLKGTPEHAAIKAKQQEIISSGKPTPPTPTPVPAPTMGRDSMELLEQELFGEVGEAVPAAAG